MNSVIEPLVFCIGKKFIDRAKDVLDLGDARRPLLQILRSMGLQPAEMSKDDVERALEELSKAGGPVAACAGVLKETALSLMTHKIIKVSRGEIMGFLGAYDLGFGIFIETILGIIRAFRPTITIYLWLVMPRSQEGSERSLQVLRDIRGRVGETPITPKEWETVQLVTKKIAKGGFTVKGLAENLWVNI